MWETDLLILGAGWTSTFLVPVLEAVQSPGKHYSFVLTSTTGRDSTTKFKFDPTASDQSYFSVLPSARYVLVTFPVKETKDAALLVDSYLDTHPRAASKVRWIVLGSTGIWQPGSPYTSNGPSQSRQSTSGEARTETKKSPWLDRHSPFDKANARAIAEEEYLRRGALVLNLSGLWDGTKRDPKNWVERVATTKEAVESKASLHMIHGLDVARALHAILDAWEADRDGDEGKRCAGQRWMLTDGFVYDWWALFAGWAAATGNKDEPSKQAQWVYELMNEKDVKALPRSMEALGRCYDSREFWKTFGLTPLKARI